MKRLFEVKGFYFQEKQQAKGFRDDLNTRGKAWYGETEVIRGSIPAFISLGPDHRRYQK
jgi:hypothetical protein